MKTALTCVQALGDCGSVNEVASAKATRDVLIQFLKFHRALMSS